MSPESMLAALIGLQVIDALTTYFGITHGAHERNPVLVWIALKLKLITNAKWAWLVAAKLFGIALAWGVVYYGDPVAQYAVLAIYCFIVANNIRVLHKLDVL